MATYPPGPPALSNNILQQYMFYRNFLKDPLGKVAGWVAEYGDVFQLQFGDSHQYMITNPEMVREILVKQSHNFNAV